MQPNSTTHSPGSRRSLIPLLIALTAMGIPATAQTTQTTVAPQTATANLVTKSDLQTTGMQMGQRITAQADELTALRQQLLALKAQMEALDRQVDGMKVPTVPGTSRILPGR